MTQPTPQPPTVERYAWWILAMNTLAFTVCFAVWMMNGVLVTFLVDNGVFRWTPSEMGWLIGIPVLTGSIFRLPLGIATDKWGGRVVMGTLLLLSAVPTWLVGICHSYGQFLWAGLAFGLTGTSFAVGVAYTSLWFPAHRQGTALGIFGAGNLGAGLTTLFAPSLLSYLTDNGERIEGWRTMPRLYAAALVVTGLVFLAGTRYKIADECSSLTMQHRLAALRSMRVWRFGLYYFLLFGGFVALAQWLVPYYVSAYGMSVVTAGLLTSVSSLSTSFTRAVGGWLCDSYGARPIMYRVFSVALLCSALLIVPQMQIRSPGSGVTAGAPGTVVLVDGQRIVIDSDTRGELEYRITLNELMPEPASSPGTVMILPRTISWHEPVVQVGERVHKRQLLARGVTEIHFQANIFVFVALVSLLGVAMGIGGAAVYKHIPTYFPGQVGVVGGLVGVLGGLGGFMLPVAFGALLGLTGLWTSCWLLLAVITSLMFWWMHRVVQQMLASECPTAATRIE